MAGYSYKMAAPETVSMPAGAAAALLAAPSDLGGVGAAPVSP